MTTREVADYLRVPLNTLYQWRHRGTGPRAGRVGKYLRYRRADVDRWIDTQLSDEQ
jgi:excisionase family DNA binding protein